MESGHQARRAAGFVVSRHRMFRPGFRFDARRIVATSRRMAKCDGVWFNGGFAFVSRRRNCNSGAKMCALEISISIASSPARLCSASLLAAGSNPASAPAPKRAGQIMFSTFAVLKMLKSISRRNVEANYRRAWDDHFAIEHDPSALRAESNVFRYRPLSRRDFAA